MVEEANLSTDMICSFQNLLYSFVKLLFSILPTWILSPSCGCWSSIWYFLMVDTVDWLENGRFAGGALCGQSYIHCTNGKNTRLLFSGLVHRAIRLGKNGRFPHPIFRIRYYLNVWCRFEEWMGGMGVAVYPSITNVRRNNVFMRSTYWALDHPLSMVNCSQL